jgi:hypothetical protein
VKKAKKRKTGKINMDGWAKVLMQDNIIKGVQEWQDGQDKAVEDAAMKKQAKEKYTAAMDIWKVWKMDWKQRNVMLKSRWDNDMKAWNVEQDNVKLDHCKSRWTKPKMLQMEKTTCKPALASFTTENPSSDKEEEEEEEEDVLMSIYGDGDNNQWSFQSGNHTLMWLVSLTQFHLIMTFHTDHHCSILQHHLIMALWCWVHSLWRDLEMGADEIRSHMFTWERRGSRFLDNGRGSLPQPFIYFTIYSI